MTLLYMKAVNTHCELHLADDSVSNTGIFPQLIISFF